MGEASASVSVFFYVKPLFVSYQASHNLCRYAIVLNSTVASFYIIIGSFSLLVTFIGTFVVACYSFIIYGLIL